MGLLRNDKHFRLPGVHDTVSHVQDPEILFLYTIFSHMRKLYFVTFHGDTGVVFRMLIMPVIQVQS